MNRLIAIIIAGFALFGFSATQANADNGLLAWPKDKVYVVDNTGPNWPVGWAAEKVDNHSPLDLVYRTSCPSKKAQCIFLSEGNPAGANTLAATTTYSIDNDITGAFIKFDKKFGKSEGYSTRVATVCHELLHAVGELGHRHTDKSCRNEYVGESTSPVPDSKDYKGLRLRY